jgi:hypothetical protein
MSHGAHLLAYSTYIIFIFYILLHVFMHRSHGTLGRHGEKRSSEHEHGPEEDLQAIVRVRSLVPRSNQLRIITISGIVSV